MKMKLPKALLLVVLASSAVYAEETTIGTIISQNDKVGEIAINPNGTSPNIVHTTIATTGTVAMDKDVKEALTQDTIKNASASLAYSIVKDGEGTLQINDGSETVVKNVLVVREGTLEISNGSHVKSAISYTNHTSCLSVGGKDAKLVLDNASFTQFISYASNYCAAISLGTADGAAQVELKNGSTIHGDHYINIGDIAGNYNVGGDYGPIGYISYTTTDGKVSGRYQGGNEKVTVTDAAGNEVTTTAYIRLDGKSEMSAGTSLQISDAVIDILGGSILKDGTKPGLSNKSTWPHSYFGYDAAEGVKTIINVYDGELDCNWNLETGNSVNSETKVTVDSNNAVFSVAGVANFGGAYDKSDNYNDTKQSKTSIILKNGGTAKFSKVIMGDAREAIISVDSDSRIVKHENPFDNTESGTIEVYGKGAIENAGTIELDVQLNGGVFTMVDGAVAAGLTATTGTINLSGDVTFTGAFTLGSGVAPHSVDGDTTPITLVIKQGANICAADFEILDNVSITVLLDEAAAESDVLFTLGYNESDDLTAFDGLDVQLADADGNATGKEVKISFGANGNVATTIIPEPTTATLSLLALMGLAARRRRK